MTGLEALDKLDEVLCDIEIKHKENLGYTKPLTKSIEKSLKALEIIKEYQVDVWLLKQCDYENYIRIRKEAMVSVGQIVNENGIILEDEITKDEFKLLKEVLK